VFSPHNIAHGGAVAAAASCYDVREDAMTRINTNVASIIAQNRLSRNTNDLQVRLERLSTGLRINRGKDDPAGLIASEILRSEKRAIGQAIDNSQRAINVISTAEGALNETSSLLLDLRALIVATANDGALTAEEVDANRLEIDSLIASIDRIANTTSFGSLKLLNGSLDYNLSSVQPSQVNAATVFSTRVPEGGTKNVEIQVLASAQTAQISAAGATTAAATIELAGNLGTEIIAFASGATIAEVAASINASRESTGVSATASSNGALYLNSQQFGSAQFVQVRALSGTFINAATFTTGGSPARDDGQDVQALVNGQLADSTGTRVDIRSSNLDARIFLDTAFAQQTTSSTSFQVTGGGSLFQLGPEVTPQAQVSVALGSVGSSNLGNAVVGFLDSIRSGGSNEVKSGNFVAAQNILGQAINQVSTLRGRLGSLQKNQIQTNINSQQVALENVSASESVIRDADIATEVSALTRSQILFQSTQSTLQISNTLPQAVLGLLG